MNAGRASLLNSRAARRQAGLSLVELMVGVAIGLFIVAGAATVVSTQLADTRRLTLESQIQQDLRATLDIMSRNFRSSGLGLTTCTNPSTPQLNLVWSPTNPNIGPNPCTTLAIAADGTTSLISAQASGGVGIGIANGYRLHLDASGHGVIQQNNSAAGWQDLTDVSTVSITGFNINFDPAPAAPTTIQLSCPNLCPVTNDRSCWPTVQLRQVTIQIIGNSVTDPSVQRQMQSTVRLRNDEIVNNMADPAGPLCPPSP